MTSEELTHGNYSVGWVCALTEELVAAKLVLDEEHPNLAIPSNDPNIYYLGSIGGHNIVITCLPEGEIGNNPAATVATRMTSSFPSIKFWLMVGIGGGVPKVRLGDVVVSAPVYETPGLVQWDLGIAQQGNNFRRIGTLNKPPEALRAAIKKLQTQHVMDGGSDKRLLSILEDIRSKPPQHLQIENLEDVLFRANYNHVSEKPKAANDDDKEEEEEEEEEDGDSDCRYCDRAKVVKRRPRNQKTMIHYGLIASGNQVIKDATRRDEINRRLDGNVLCFEMEGAGITVSHPCLVIRGISGKFLKR